MVTNIKLTVIIVFIYATTIYSSCGKSIFGCPEESLSFHLNAKAYPDKDSIHAGDTIWIELRAPTSLKDDISGKMIDYSGASNLGNAISIDKFIGGSISNPGTSYSANSFIYILSSGSAVNNSLSERIRSYLFEENNGLYFYKLGIIPKEAGVFAFAISDATNVYRKTDKCTKAHFNITFANTDQHLYFYQNNRPGYVISDYEQTHMYCFKVY